MSAILQHQSANATTYQNRTFSLTALWRKFIAWSTDQHRNRFLWIAISLLGHGTFFTIATISTVVITGNVFALLVATIFSMAMVVIVNLAALPTKYTIPILLLSLLADVAIIITAIAMWWH